MISLAIPSKISISRWNQQWKSVGIKHQQYMSIKESWNSVQKWKNGEQPCQQNKTCVGDRESYYINEAKRSFLGFDIAFDD